MLVATTDHLEMRSMAGADLEVRASGSGEPLLLLHGCHGWWGWEDVLDRLSRQFAVVAPSHPGFGHSPRVSGIDTVDDLAYFYLDLLAGLDSRPARVMGFGLGGWIAAEIAVRCPHAVDRLVLVDSVGIKVSDRETRDIADPFILSPSAHQQLLWHDAASHRAPLPEPGAQPEVLEPMLRNLESAMYYGWKPYMHNPKLRQRLHRIAAATLVVWGEEDRIVSREYGRAFAAEIRGSRFVTIRGAGHYPHREQVDAFVAEVAGFLA
jgi:pimeloyl-ACP methyl ester carboxylesterase